LKRKRSSKLKKRRAKKKKRASEQTGHEVVFKIAAKGSWKGCKAGDSKGKANENRSLLKKEDKKSS